MTADMLPDRVVYGDLPCRGVTRHVLERFVAEGSFERIAPGVFLRSGLTDDTTAAWIAAAVKKPGATLCLLSALALHDLTDEIPSRSDIAVPRGVMPPKIDFASIRWHRFDPASFEVGRLRYQIPGEVSIGLYSPERTIIDLFRLRHDWGSDVAIDALKRWLRQPGSSPAALLAMAKHFPRVVAGIRHVLEILL